MSISEFYKREARRMRFEDFMEEDLSGPGPDGWVTVCEDCIEDLEIRSIHCALIPESSLRRELASAQSGIHGGGGMPSWEDGQYLRYGRDDGMEPLVFRRSFAGIVPEYTELSEEFRHFFRLHEDRSRQSWVEIDEAGNPIDAARGQGRRVEIRRSYLNRFLCAKRMILMVGYALTRFSEADAGELDLPEKPVERRGNWSVFLLAGGPWEQSARERYQSFTRLLGKKMMMGEPEEEAVEEFEEFIIGADAEGRPVKYSCDPDGLADGCGANAAAPNYLKSVFFRPEVLDKYRAEPGKYSFDGSLLCCGSLWQVSVGESRTGHVVVHLGDLGRDVPASERRHWLQYNIAPVAPRQ